MSVKSGGSLERALPELDESNDVAMVLAIGLATAVPDIPASPRASTSTIAIP